MVLHITKQQKTTAAALGEKAEKKKAAVKNQRV